MDNKRKLLVGASLVSIVFIVFSALVIHSENSLKVEEWHIETSYRKGTWGSLYSMLEVKITIGVGNTGVFPVTLHNGKIKLIINGVDMGSLPLEEEWYIISSFSWREFLLTYGVSGDDAESLYSTDTYDIKLVLRAETSCIFYRTLLETTHKKKVTMVPK